MSGLNILKQVLDSKDFTVGGGSAAALAGAMAAGLVGMVAQLSVKKDYGLSPERNNEIAEEADNLVKELLSGAVEDTQAFSMIKEAYSLPKSAPEEKAVRAAAVQQAAIAAATVPKDNAWRCRKVQELSLLLEGRSNPNASSDLGEAMYLAGAGIIGCVLNIEINLSLIKDENVKADFQEQANQLRQYAKESCNCKS